MEVRQFNADYHDGAFHALLNLRNWMDIHSKALAGYFGIGERDGELKSLKVKSFINAKTNKNVRELIMAFIKDLDTFMTFGEDTEVRRWVDEKNETIRVEVDKEQ